MTPIQIPIPGDPITWGIVAIAISVVGEVVRQSSVNHVRVVRETRDEIESVAESIQLSVSSRIESIRRDPTPLPPVPNADDDSDDETDVSDDESGPSPFRPVSFDTDVSDDVSDDTDDETDAMDREPGEWVAAGHSRYESVVIHNGNLWRVVAGDDDRREIESVALDDLPDPVRDELTFGPTDESHVVGRFDRIRREE
jgi:hypothetical protein